MPPILKSSERSPTATRRNDVYNWKRFIREAVCLPREHLVCGLGMSIPGAVWPALRPARARQRLGVCGCDGNERPAFVDSGVKRGDQLPHSAAASSTPPTTLTITPKSPTSSPNTTNFEIFGALTNGSNWTEAYEVQAVYPGGGLSAPVSFVCQTTTRLLHPSMLVSTPMAPPRQGILWLSRMPRERTFS